MSKKPNIILITIDCLRVDHCGWLNPKNKKLTPFLNDLAEKSFVFTQAYATGPSTVYAFPGILTGTYPLSFRGWDGKNFPALEQRPYLPEILHFNGYSTIAVNNNPFLSVFFGYNQGFDVFRGFRSFYKIKKRLIFKIRIVIKENKYLFFEKFSKYKWYSYLKYFIFKINKIFYNFLNFIIHLTLRKSGNPPLVITAAKTINEAVFKKMMFAKNPRFLWVHYMDTHEPYFYSKDIILSNIEEKKLKKINNQFKFLAPYQNLKKEEYKLIKKIYQNNLQYLDQQIGQLFNKLKEKLKNSIIIIVADHGQVLGENGEFGHGDDIRKKYNKYVLHVPLLIKTPEGRGRVIDEIVSCAQIPATILNLVEITPPPEMEPSLFNHRKTRVYSESLLDHSPLFDYFDLTTIQKIVHFQ